MPTTPAASPPRRRARRHDARVHVEAVEGDAPREERNPRRHAVGGGTSGGQEVALEAERGRFAEHEVPFDRRRAERQRGRVEEQAEGARAAVVEGVDVVGLLVGPSFRRLRGGRAADGEGAEQPGEHGEDPGCHAPLSDARAKSCVSRYRGSPMSDAAPPRYPYVAVDVTEDDVDEAGALLFELGAAGVEQRDATTLVRGALGKVTLVASFERAEEAHAATEELPEAWGPRVEEVVGDAWRDEWKKHFEPFRVCEGVVVRPPWRHYAAAPGERVMVLEPGRAFGTGLHETTSLVAEELAQTPLDGVTVLDMGCGSGVLSLIALALGAARARAIDVDPDAVAVTRENADRNGVAERVETDETPVDALPVATRSSWRTSSRRRWSISPRRSSRASLPGGLLVLSGILSAAVMPAQLADIRRAFAALHEEGVRTKGEWIAVRMRRS